MAIEPIMLTPEDQKMLEDLGLDLTALEDELAKAERAGIDVSEIREKVEAGKKLREGILREYGR